ncbi:hypothetical protein M9H77_37197 [Catharanthus roseus]|uniref:Uncharacterized protein n=1 Tax=Catharanthus roseus TaxID=4058 RepID=A0ACB9ZW62_CATRO|nr:hypothetical protein M9H77_37197 [Catharanthus roseus]
MYLYSSRSFISSSLHPSDDSSYLAAIEWHFSFAEEQIHENLELHSNYFFPLASGSLMGVLRAGISPFGTNNVHSLNYGIHQILPKCCSSEAFQAEKDTKYHTFLFTKLD